MGRGRDRGWGSESVYGGVERFLRVRYSLTEVKRLKRDERGLK